MFYREEDKGSERSAGCSHIKQIQHQSLAVCPQGSALCPLTPGLARRACLSRVTDRILHWVVSLGEPAGLTSELLSVASPTARGERLYWQECAELWGFHRLHFPHPPSRPETGVNILIYRNTNK